MRFELSTELNELRTRVRRFIDEHILPAEEEILAQASRGDRTSLKGLQERARAEHLWTPHLPREYGGLGLGVMGMCALFREMGRSPIGAKVFNCDAPDQGNMDLLLSAGSVAQRERWLKPLANAEITSGFSMTEPAPGAGADPSNLRTRAIKDGDSYVIDGHKWFTTGGDHASFLIVMARTSDDRENGASMFLVERSAPGVKLVRNVPVMAPDLLDHLEAELRFEGVRVREDALLGRAGDGFRLAQQRLVPARLTHCMRWLGLAERTLQLCKKYLHERVSFGKPLESHQLVQHMIAENATAIHAGNLMTLHCAHMLEAGRGKEARAYSSMTKNHVARLLCRTLDDAIQMHGALGYSHDMPFARWYASARAARIADGPDEVHEVVIAREFLAGRLELLV
jgi:acyl-CoA dehydrogenase